VRLLRGLARTRAVFDDPNLLPNVGLAPLLALAGRARLPELLAGVRPGGPCGVGPITKAQCLVAGMAAGADCIDDMGLLLDVLHLPEGHHREQAWLTCGQKPPGHPLG
jgi:hypothetical protein